MFEYLHGLSAWERGPINEAQSMKYSFLMSVASLGLLGLSLPGMSPAGEVTIVAADFQPAGGDRWSVQVTLKHDDSGWDHYADEWRVVDAAGTVLGDRVLFHPHVGEQPFTRGLGSVAIPAGTRRVWVEAHDKVHGWTQERLEVDLSKPGRPRGSL